MARSLRGLSHWVTDAGCLKGGLGNIFQYRFLISTHPRRSVSNTCRRHVSVLPLHFKIVSICALTCKTKIVTVVRCAANKVKGFAPLCCLVSETRVQLILHMSWPLSCTKGRLSTPFHISNPQATICFQIVILIHAFPNSNQSRRTHTHTHMHITQQ